MPGACPECVEANTRTPTFEVASPLALVRKFSFDDFAGWGEAGPSAIAVPETAQQGHARRKCNREAWVYDGELHDQYGVSYIDYIPYREVAFSAYNATPVLEYAALSSAASSSTASARTLQQDLRQTKGFPGSPDTTYLEHDYGVLGAFIPQPSPTTADSDSTRSRGTGRPTLTRREVMKNALKARLQSLWQKVKLAFVRK